MPTLFFSYSHADEALRDQLEKQLAMLKRQGVIEKRISKIANRYSGVGTEAEPLVYSQRAASFEASAAD